MEVASYPPSTCYIHQIGPQCLSSFRKVMDRNSCVYLLHKLRVLIPDHHSRSLEEPTLGLFIMLPKGKSNTDEIVYDYEKAAPIVPKFTNIESR